MRAVFALILALPALAAAERPVLEISGATFRPYPLAVQKPIAAGDASAAAAALDEALLFDLEVSGLFEVIPRSAFLADPREGLEKIAFERWSDVGAEGLVKVQVSGTAPNAKATFRLWDVVARRVELEKTYDGEPRRIAHRFADDLVRHFTREPGAFDTQLAYVRRQRGAKEIWVSHWDGHGARAVTERGGLALLPSWAPSGDQLSFTYYRRTPSYPNGHPQIWVTPLAGPAKALVTRGDLNTGAAFSPDGTRVAYTVSEDGNSEIWVSDRNGANARRLTREPGIDTSPAWSPDSRRIAFVSDRHGTPQIFVMDADGGNVDRLTRQGNYNQTPAWSPRGDELAFTARDERLVFDIFVINLESREVRRITQDQGNNEHPTWSPNGRLLAFTSTRDGKPSIWVSSHDGNVQRRVSPKDGAEHSSPSWGPFRK